MTVPLLKDIAVHICTPVDMWAETEVPSRNPENACPLALVEHAAARKRSNQ